MTVRFIFGPLLCSSLVFFYFTVERSSAASIVILLSGAIAQIYSDLQYLTDLCVFIYRDIGGYIVLLATKVYEFFEYFFKCIRYIIQRGTAAISGHGKVATGG
jgi:hypothetical protein